MKNIHLLPTDKASKLFYNKIESKFIIDGDFENTIKEDWFQDYNIYITSDEEIKVDDWCIINSRYISKCVRRSKTYINGSFYTSGCKKITLTTDKDLIKNGVQLIDDEFLVWFIENSNCEEINIETIMECDNCGREHCDNLQCRGYKDSPYYKIIIPKEELNYNVKQVKKNNLKNTQFEYELQAMIYEVLKENNNSSVELQSSKLVECVTDYFNHIECTFIIKNGDKTNVKKGKLV